MARFSVRILGLCGLVALGANAHAADSILTSAATAEAFPLVGPAGPAPIWFDASDATVVSIAASDFAADVERVTGQKPVVEAMSTTGAAPDGSAVLQPASPVPGDPTRELKHRATTSVVLIGTLGHSALIDALVETGHLDATPLAGRWETFLITTVEHPMAGVDRALVIAGSDRRGTAYGVYEVSQQIGVSPWYWWADVPAKRQTELYVRAGVTLMGPPSVKYRGIFINDEDWGLQPWAAKTFAPEEGGIGPKVYRQVFELLLRLKANTLWPAMHACSQPFNAFPENKQLADDYGIVMGSSHAEPMLRNNVGEWSAPHDQYNYVANRDGVLRYWEERVASNGRFENIYTVGMRGIHDSAIQGTKTDAERIAVLEKVFADQRALLAKHVNPEVEQVPQMFCAYKEVLDLYRQGLKVPEDVTIVWPDDNFGYIRNFASPEEQRTRTGGFGVYYHVSYLGRPMAYLWLCTTPPALIWEEMSKAYDHGARQIWIVNVGDIKPAEIGTEFFLQMAWDINRWNRETLPHFLEEWATREFGPAHAPEIAGIMRDYYQLNYQRKPEHLQWWLPRAEPRPSPLTAEESRRRMRSFISLNGRLASLMPLPRPQGEYDSFFELLGYPVMGSALANLRYFSGELAAMEATDGSKGESFEQASAFDESLRDFTRAYGGVFPPKKWEGFMHLEPADGQWNGMRIEPWRIPDFRHREVGGADAVRGAHASRVPAGASRPSQVFGEPPKTAGEPPALPGPGDSAVERFHGFGEAGGVISFEAEHFTRQSASVAGAWRVVRGLGRTGEGSVAVFPTTVASVNFSDLPSDAPCLEYDILVATPGECTLSANLIPTHPLVAGRGLRFAIGFDDQPPQMIVVSREVGDAAWSQGVLNNAVTGSTTITVPTAGKHVLKLFMVDAGVVIDKIVIDGGGLRPSYLGPPETRVRPE